MLLSKAIKSRGSRSKVKSQARMVAQKILRAREMNKRTSQPQFVSGTEEEFDARFGEATRLPEAKGSAYPSQATLDKALKQRRLWTMVEGYDGSLYLQSGYHFVNRLDYYTSEKPYPEGFVGEYRLEGADD